MTGLELKEIVEKIKADGVLKDEDIAKAIRLNRSYISRKLNEDAKVAGKFLKKFRDAYPNYFVDSNKGNNGVKSDASEIMYDSKEGVLRLLKQALDENARHASANEKNASAHEKNATSIQEVVKLLRIKLNSTGTGSTSRSSKEEKKQRKSHEERKPLFEGKPENDSILKKKSKKGTVTEKGK